MFLSNKLINLLFANPQDTYYAEGLLKFNDLNQYIWYLLHKNQNCDVVYFLREKNSRFEVSGFGENGFDGFVPHLKFFKSVEDQFEKWMEERLTDGAAKCAFVCSLSDFCSLLEKKEYEKLLHTLIKMKSRTDRRGFIVLTSPPIVEDSKRLLLQSSVFSGCIIGKTEKYLSAAIANLRYKTNKHTFDYIYDELSQQMGAACVFLNRFDEESIGAIVNHFILRENITECAVDPNKLINYLSVILNSEEFRTFQVLQGFFEEGFLQFQGLYRKLCIPENWKLVEKEYNACGFGLFSQKEHMVPVYYTDTTINRCLMLRIPEEFVSCNRIVDKLLSMKKMLLKVKNRDINTLILGEMGKTLSVYAQEIKSGDIDDKLLGLLVSLLHFYATWLYVKTHSNQEENVLKLSEYVETYLNYRKSYLMIKKANLSGSEVLDLSPDAKRIREIRMRQIEAEIDMYREQLPLLEQAIYTQMAAIQTGDTNFGSITDIIKELSKTTAVKEDPEEVLQDEYSDDVEFVEDDEKPISVDLDSYDYNEPPAFYIDVPKF